MLLPASQKKSLTLCKKTLLCVESALNENSPFQAAWAEPAEKHPEFQRVPPCLGSRRAAPQEGQFETRLPAATRGGLDRFIDLRCQGIQSNMTDFQNQKRLTRKQACSLFQTLSWVLSHLVMSDSATPWTLATRLLCP